MQIFKSSGMDDRLRKPRPAMAGSECIRDLCKRTGTGGVPWIADQIEFTVNVSLSYPFAVLLR